MSLDNLNGCLRPFVTSQSPIPSRKRDVSVSKISLYWSVLLLFAGCSSTNTSLDDIYGRYVPVTTQGTAHFWEGDVITIAQNGYRHSRFTDEIGPWIEEPPYTEYEGEIVVTGNTIRFKGSWLNPTERVFVRVGSSRYLITPKEYNAYLESNELPEIALQAK